MKYQIVIDVETTDPKTMTNQDMIDIQVEAVYGLFKEQDTLVYSKLDVWGVEIG